MKTWFYEENGQQRGPISESDLVTMFANRLLSLETRVWTAAFGNEWRPASQTPLAEARGVMPPPLASTGTTAAQPLTSALQDAAPSDLWAYLLAFSPLLLIVLEMVFYNPLFPAPGDKVPVAGVWLGLLLAWADARNLSRSRRNPQMRRMVPFVLLTPIGYFWRRWAITRTSIKFLWIWIACFVAYVISVAALSGA
ncbi:DUF4339 domain-containing protein [Mesorhizobium sp. ORM8.1]